MKTKLFLIAVCLAVIFVALAQAADVTGKWTAQVPGRGGQTRETTFNFKVDGENLTGTMSTQQGETAIQDGKVSGDDISFSVTMSFQGNAVKIVFNGKVSGDEIKFTRHREGSDQTQEFTAKRAK